jgi:D-3-phosphoglycerate dehydrogenase
MLFKVVDILGISAFVGYEEMFKDAGVDVQLDVNPCSPESTEDDIIAAIGDADAVVAQTTSISLSRKVIGGLAKCRLISSLGVGYDYLDVDAATEFGILAANVPDASVREVSDHTMALILACTRCVVRLNEIVRQGDWMSLATPRIAGEIWPKLSSLEGQTLGLIAFGRLAKAVVPKAKGFGLRVIAYDPYLPPDEFHALEVEQVNLDRLLSESDIVSMHLPQTPETIKLVGMEQFKKMKPNACLVNTGRGITVDHEALYVALTQGLISSAALDVTEPEPIPPDSPLLDLDNLIVTAHSAGISPQALEEIQRRPAKEIIRVIKGEWPVGLLNPEVKEKYLSKWA